MGELIERLFLKYRFACRIGWLIAATESDNFSVIFLAANPPKLIPTRPALAILPKGQFLLFDLVRTSQTVPMLASVKPYGVSGVKRVQDTNAAKFP